MSEEIILNWILYSSNMRYDYKTYSGIKEFIFENFDEALNICTYLYLNGEDSTKLILGVMENNYMKYLKNMSFMRDNLKEIFLTDNANRYIFYKSENYANLDELLLNWLSRSGLFIRKTNMYMEFVSLIKRRPEDIFNVLFVGLINDEDLLDKLLLSIENETEDVFFEKIKILNRNARITNEAKYKYLKDEFLLALASDFYKTMDDNEETLEMWIRNYMRKVTNLDKDNIIALERRKNNEY